MSDSTNNIELLVEEFEERLFEEIEKLKPVQRQPVAERKKDVHFIMKDSIHRKLKMWCAGEGVTISEVLEDLCLKFLNEKGKMGNSNS